MQFAAYFYTVVSNQALLRLSVYKIQPYQGPVHFLSFCTIRDFGSPTILHNNLKRTHLNDVPLECIKQRSSGVFAFRNPLRDGRTIQKAVGIAVGIACRSEFNETILRKGNVNTYIYILFEIILLACRSEFDETILRKGNVSTYIYILFEIILLACRSEFDETILRKGNVNTYIYILFEIILLACRSEFDETILRKGNVNTYIYILFEIGQPAKCHGVWDTYKVIKPSHDCAMNFFFIYSRHGVTMKWAKLDLV